jgi:hypothetical protein
VKWNERCTFLLVEIISINKEGCNNEINYVATAVAGTFREGDMAACLSWSSELNLKNLHRGRQ